MRNIISVITFLCVAGSATAQDQANLRILVLGDGWSEAMWEDRCIKAALENAGLGMYEETYPGFWRAAGEMAGAPHLAMITDELTKNSTMK